jgi:hypothetical protein
VTENLLAIHWGPPGAISFVPPDAKGSIYFDFRGRGV